MGNADTSAAWTYHNGTKHSLESVRRSPHFLDWENMPHPFKVYRDLEPIALPRKLPSSTKPALDSIRGTVAGDGPTKIDLLALARALHFSAGVLHTKTYPGGEVHYRAAACTGALYHIDAYVICADLDGLDAGVYHFGPHDFSLRRLRNGDHRGAVVAASGNAPGVARAPVILAYTSTFWRNAWKYRARTYRHCFWDSGTMLANLLAVTAAVDLPARIVLGFVDRDLNLLLDLDSRREVTLALVGLGKDAGPAPAPPSFDRLGLETAPLSAKEIDYAAIRAMHEASILESADEVKRWRRPLPVARADTKKTPIRLTSTTALEEPIESVIRRRGSTRVFARDPIALDSLSTILQLAAAEISADFSATGCRLANIHVIANAVEGLPSGAYRLDAETRALVEIRKGEYRPQAGHLGLGQALAADAAADVYWLSDLRHVLPHFGNRGYRAAQLEAAIGGGRAYLASYALRIGATGLTFFDDDVANFFEEPEHAVMFLTAHGHGRRGSS